ncbi:MAG: Re/Si-specific NAD(P)(+) transhydrogenase subunit alpha [Alphaproteobacteria bacterium]
MKIGIPKEIRAGETRLAASPDSVKRFAGLGIETLIETGAGAKASITDAALQAAGARIVAGTAALYDEADLVLKVQRPMTEAEGGPDELGLMRQGTVLVGLLQPLYQRAQVEDYAKRGITSFAMELIPRISRAQSMDALSSQSNVAGYKAVIDAAASFGRMLPMMMTAAGTIPAARVVVFGAGVAGLQAIATARRLGALVSAFDVRPAVKEQVESLGASFIEVASAETAGAETAGGYAREMSEDYQRRQREVIHDTLRKQDIAITTALIPGKPAPKLITAETVEGMKPGSVIVDLAADAGGNCALTVPGEVVVRHGVTIIGHTNYPTRVPTDCSTLYARNLFNFIAPMIDKETKSLKIDLGDEVVKGALLTRDGQIVNAALQGKES